MVSLRYKAKPNLGFQNLECHCKIIGCRFDTQKRLKKALMQTLPSFHNWAKLIAAR